MHWEFGTLGKLFEELQVQSVEISLPRAKEEGAKPDFCYVRMRTSMGSVEAKAQTFSEAFEAIVESVDVLQLNLRSRGHR